MQWCLPLRGPFRVFSCIAFHGGWLGMEGGFSCFLLLLVIRHSEKKVCLLDVGFVAASSSWCNTYPYESIRSHFLLESAFPTRPPQGLEKSLPSSFGYQSWQPSYLSNHSTSYGLYHFQFALNWLPRFQSLPYWCVPVGLTDSATEVAGTTKQSSTSHCTYLPFCVTLCFSLFWTKSYCQTMCFDPWSILFVSVSKMQMHCKPQVKPSCFKISLIYVVS